MVVPERRRPSTNRLIDAVACADLNPVGGR
jgi:hypothetical protein